VCKHDGMALPPPPPLPPAQPVAPSSRTNGMAIASLCCAVASFVTGVTSILAIIFGHVALSQIKRDPTQGGRAMALAGMIIGYAILAMVVFVVISVWNLDD
jgi:Domain of unknown function (DUF4190)